MFIEYRFEYNLIYKEWFKAKWIIYNASTLMPD